MIDWPNVSRLIAGDRRDPRVVLEEVTGTASKSGSPPADALEWGRAVLAAEGVDALVSPVEAIRALREAEPRLGLRTAKYLAEHLAR